MDQSQVLSKFKIKLKKIIWSKDLKDLVFFFKVSQAYIRGVKTS